MSQVTENQIWMPALQFFAMQQIEYMCIYILGFRSIKYTVEFGNHLSLVRKNANITSYIMILIIARYSQIPSGYSIRKVVAMALSHKTGNQIDFFVQISD